MYIHNSPAREDELEALYMCPNVLCYDAAVQLALRWIPLDSY